MRLDDITQRRWYTGRTGKPRGVIDIRRSYGGAATVRWTWSNPWKHERECSLETFARWAREEVSEACVRGLNGEAP